MEITTLATQTKSEVSTGTPSITCGRCILDAKYRFERGQLNAANQWDYINFPVFPTYSVTSRNQDGSICKITSEGPITLASPVAAPITIVQENKSAALKSAHSVFATVLASEHQVTSGGQPCVPGDLQQINSESTSRMWASLAIAIPLGAFCIVGLLFHAARKILKRSGYAVSNREVKKHNPDDTSFPLFRKAELAGQDSTFEAMASEKGKPELAGNNNRQEMSSPDIRFELTSESHRHQMMGMEAAAELSCNPTEVCSTPAASSENEAEKSDSEPKLQELPLNRA